MKRLHPKENIPNKKVEDFPEIYYGWYTLNCPIYLSVSLPSYDGKFSWHIEYDVLWVHLSDVMLWSVGRESEGEPLYEVRRDKIQLRSGHLFPDAHPPPYKVPSN